MKVLNKLMVKINERLYRAVMDKNITELNTQVGDIRSRIITLHSLNNQSELQKILGKYQKWVDAAVPAFECEEENIAYQMGLLAGTVATVIQLQEEQKQLEKYEVAHITHMDTKYRDKIIECLMDTEYVQHNQLAQKLGISSSQLTTIMSRVDGEEQNIISTSRVGKFKYYCLTNMGRRYYSGQHMGNFREEILELLKSILDRGKRRKKNAIKKFVDQYYVNDIELKQKAMEIEYLFDSLEKKEIRYIVKPSEPQNIRFLFGKERMGRQFCGNNEVSFVANMPYDVIKGMKVNISDVSFMEYEEDEEWLKAMS